MEITLEQLTFLFTVVNSTVLALLFLVLKFGIEKRLKKYEYEIGDAGELNRKMHDRLVGVENCIEHLNPISKQDITRLQMNASRLEKHDSSIPNDVDMLIKTWGDAFFPNAPGAVNMVTWKQKKKESLGLIKVIKVKVDKIVK